MMVIRAVASQLNHYSVDSIQDSFVVQFVLFLQMGLHKAYVFLLIFEHPIHTQLAFEDVVSLIRANILRVFGFYVRKVSKSEIKVHPF